MMKLSKTDLEMIGKSVLRDYVKRAGNKVRLPLDISRFASEYLGLSIQYRKLSDNGKVLGLTTYKDILLELPLAGGCEVVSVPMDSILLDDALLRDRLPGRGRYTIAHECAHQILARIEEKHTGISYRTAFQPGQSYSCRELKSAEDWSEWQANALGAVLLMPRANVIRQFEGLSRNPRLTLFGKKLNSTDYHVIRVMALRFSVSKSAMLYRLREMGLVEQKSEAEYYDPFDCTAAKGGAAI